MINVGDKVKLCIHHKRLLCRGTNAWSKKFLIKRQKDTAIVLRTYYSGLDEALLDIKWLSDGITTSLYAYKFVKVP